MPQEIRDKVSRGNKGKVLSEETKRKMRGRVPWNKDKKWDEWMTPEQKEKAYKNIEKNLRFSTEDHPNWKGGLSFEEYTKEFNNKLKESIRKIDGYKCQLCGKLEKDEGKRLSIHHIDYDKKNNNPINLITLCVSCHCKTNFKRDYYTKLFNLRHLKYRHIDFTT